MKHYPKIENISVNPLIGVDCIAFDKLDGSNLRFEWNKKRGWYKFGTRNRMFDKNDSDFGCAIDMFISKYGDSIEKIMKDQFPRTDSVIAFAEFFGPYSFAGCHDDIKLASYGKLPDGKTNEPLDIVLFDFCPHKIGFVSPYEFIKLFSNVEIPRVIYDGKMTLDFVDKVRNGEFDVKEGVIVKGGSRHELWMRKIKTHSYLNELKNVFGNNWVNYGE